MRGHSKRDRKLWKAMWSGLSGVLAVILVGVLSGWLGGTAQGFWGGFGFGVLLMLPLALGVMTWRLYRQMDEYGRQLHQRAASFAFALTMLLTALGFVVQNRLHLDVPLWSVYTFGMLSWGLATAVIAARERGRS